MKLYDFRECAEFNQLREQMGAHEYGHFTEFDPDHQLTYGEREQMAASGMQVGAGDIRILRDRTIALKNSRVWVADGERFHVAGCPELAQLRHDQLLMVSTRDPGKQLHICAECLAELKYLGLDARRSRRMSDQLDELFSMSQFRDDYPFYPVSG